ncbi:4'-phosphopantetheinyl transferase family protein [Undibacterium sp. Ji67W]|uniref:4'-phosphopantetheinyl transferase family protein n=1 Tax=Undibacterium sp. Ji67W TaxID=3413042 RepID=UPI003BF44ECC
MQFLKPPSVGADGIAVWVLGLKSTAALDVGLSVLSVAESDRAKAIARESKRQEFIAARVALRLLIARYIGIDPKTIEFDRTTGPLNVSGYPIKCSVAHRHGRVAVAISPHYHFGIDLEKFRHRENELSGFEILFDRQYVPNVESGTFLAAWCELEALTKLRGTHLPKALTEWRQILNAIGLPGILPADRIHNEVRFSHWEPFPMWRLVLASCKAATINIQIDE